ncbi:hypothetical protein CYMTET_28698 [Cymbomonas tetramitiformis]|uniref:Uncharacterized protein n=1 Tax=Cymbomonas tetramitiformis TaxID=36881 RepID=A0AAE0FMM1_9CHLO|nr:hypothetical protein CYMTET_28698 [Cymbomonas tetramitiformis]
MSKRRFQEYTKSASDALGGNVEEFFERWVCQVPDRLRFWQEKLGTMSPAIFGKDDAATKRAIAMVNDCLLSVRNYQYIREHMDGKLPPYYKLQSFMQMQDAGLTELKDREGATIGYAVKDILRDIIFPELEDYLRRHARETVGCETIKLHYKHAADNFSDTDFFKTLHPNEQYLFYLIDKTRPCNSILFARPLIFCPDQKETSELMKVICQHVDPQLPRAGDKIELPHPTTGNLITFELLDFFAMDYALVANVHMFQGQKWTHGCVHGPCKFGCPCNAALAGQIEDDRMKRTLPLMKFLGEINSHYRVPARYGPRRV